MAIYQFGNQFSFTNLGPGPRATTPVPGATEPNPHLWTAPIAAKQASDTDGRIANTWERGTVTPNDVEEFIEPGFRYLDEGMKLYWSDIRIPTKDTVRFLRVKIAGVNKAVQVWTEDLMHGRVSLPVMSISRSGHTFNPEKFNPAYHPMAMRFTDKSGRRVRLTYRPVPYLVEYTLTILAETKREVEYAAHQILTRFSPLAEFRVSDNHIVGNVQLRPGACSDVSDKEVSADQLAKIKYEISTTVEAWLSLPEQVIPTVITTRGGLKVDNEMVNWERFNIGVANG